MKDILHNIRSLIMQEIDGQLTEEERVFLLRQVSEDPEVAELRRHLWETVGSEEVNKYLTNHTTETQSARLLSRIEPKRQSKRTLVYLASAVAAAAAIVLFITNIGVFRRIINATSPSGLVSTNTTSKQVQLTLSTGTVYNFNKDTLVNSSGANWKVAGKTLTLTESTSTSERSQLATLTVPAGKDYTLVLPDGSRIQVNAATTVRFPLKFDKQFREIYVRGECYIKAAHDPLKPFFVHLPGSTVQVLGTEFNVNAYDSLAKVALVSGKVKLTHGDDSTLLQPGLMGIVSGTKIETGRFDEYETLSWRTGMFVFRNAKFEDVCKVIPRWFGVQVVFDNQQLSDKRYSGLIDRYQPLDLQLKGLQATGAIEYRIAADSVIHIHFN